MTGKLDGPGALPPKEESWCVRKEKWMLEVVVIFHKDRVME